jgi:integrase/recombinase XerD
VFQFGIADIIELIGSKWIYIERSKTNQPVRIPLLNIAEEILSRFDLKGNEAIFPVPTNQKMNAYLKEIASICRIDKNLSTHTARRTFATSVTLLNV